MRELYSVVVDADWCSVVDDIDVVVGNLPAVDRGNTAAYFVVDSRNLIVYNRLNNNLATRDCRRIRNRPYTVVKTGLDRMVREYSESESIDTVDWRCYYYHCCRY